MHIYAAINCATDAPFWVSREVFYKHFDQADFMNRDSAVIKPAYLYSWFYSEVSGKLMFYIPVVGAIGPRTDLISSRHRLAVLLPYMTELPFAFAFGAVSPEAKEFLDSIPKRPLDIESPIWLPDLPICNELP